MKLSKLLLVPAVALGLCSASCVTDSVSIQITQAIAGAIDSSCALTAGGNTQLVRGAVDLRYKSENPGYWLALRVVSNMEATELTGGGSNYNPGSRNDFNVRKVTFHYTGDGVPEMTDEMTLSGTIPPQSEADFAFNILSERVRDSLGSIATPEGREVIVEIKLSGEFAHGAEYETAPFAFPLVVSSNVRYECTDAQEEVARGLALPPCMNWGQDGIVYECVCRVDLPDCPEGKSRNPKTCVCE
ncbi:MAG: hypothetical protein ACOX6T_13160 [Myxococcales bacterium]